ncbi:TetR family transcriptional regulator [Nocardioides sp. zg-ZUI104]|uniref:TetR/AcrR family transcriptional regulator n=1 Tax=Nocardioides faecalis TaxID=2803858 RepID=UPI001BCC5E78|nr:TetR/AcrR family transcriptional regulator [Nocardioides faecalis]MBS4754518.1 TetR family transcriptional regulator [Nocardioides faecalis]
MPATPNRRQAKRHQTAQRLQQCALRLTLDKGYDGWTVDDLAEEAGVSRRTVFNYFDGKAEIVLGPPLYLDREQAEVFVAGGPTGNLLADALALAADMIAAHTTDEMFSASRNAILSDVVLIKLVHERFTAITDEFVDLMQQREGDAFDPARARLLTNLVVAIFDNAAERAEAQPDRPFSEHFHDAVIDARAVLS